MAHPIGYYTNCPQGEALTLLFGDRDLARLPQIDQAALLAILGKFVYESEASPSGEADQILLGACAEDVISADNDATTDAIVGAIACLNGISKDDALAVISFLAQ